MGKRITDKQTIDNRQRAIHSIPLVNRRGINSYNTHILDEHSHSIVADRDTIFNQHTSSPFLPSIESVYRFLNLRAPRTRTLWGTRTRLDQTRVHVCNRERARKKSHYANDGTASMVPSNARPLSRAPLGSKLNLL